LGIGIGIIIGVICMLIYKNNVSLSDYEIEQKARDLGMIYSNEQKSIIKGEDNK